jgi:hypothetical protein
VASEIQELAAPPEKEPSLHAPADPAHSAAPHLEYQGFRAQFVTVPAGPLPHMVVTMGQVRAINQPQSVVFTAAPLLAAQKEHPA